MSAVDLQQRRIKRERKARLAAEAILERKSLELHQATVEAQEATERIRAQNVKIQAILDYAAEGIITIDGTFEITSANPAATRIFGYEQSEIQGKQLSDLVIGADERCQSVWDSVEGIHEAKEFSGRRVDGSEIIIEMTVSCVKEDRLETMIAFVRDRTKRVHLQTQLALAQKMESVGQLAAGIAHEVNTPIQYVGDNAKFLKDAFADIDGLLDLYESLAVSVSADNEHSELIKRIESQKEMADLAFIREEVPQAIEQAIFGVDRVASIVRAMKEFSHPGVAKQTAFGVNQALQSTIMVSTNEWKYIADLETDFSESQPQCLGFPGDLNQAFLNLIVNAAHAIEKRQESEKDHKGVIRIATRVEQDWIVISISDNGNGISQSNQSRIFDPFFTTKPVGKGTGQGLSITHGIIVEKHSGQLELESKVGQGTKFTIRIPKASKSRFQAAMGASNDEQ